MSYSSHPSQSDPSHSSTDRSLAGSSNSGNQSFFQQAVKDVEDFFTTGWPGQKDTKTQWPWSGGSGNGASDFLNSWTFFLIVIAALVFLVLKFT